jgi:hypothetical protein
MWQPFGTLAVAATLIRYSQDYKQSLPVLIS